MRTALQSRPAEVLRAASDGSGDPSSHKANNLHNTDTSGAGLVQTPTQRRSEYQFQSHLDIARIEGVRNSSEIRVGRAHPSCIVVGQIKIRVVECIEELGAILQSNLLSIVVVLHTARSSRNCPGPVRMFRGELPKELSGVGKNAAVLNHF